MNIILAQVVVGGGGGGEPLGFSLPGKE